AFPRVIAPPPRHAPRTPARRRPPRVPPPRPRTAPASASRAGCVPPGLAPATTALGPGMAAKTARQAMASPRNGAPRRHPARRGQPGHPTPDPSPSKTGGTGTHALTPREFADWAAGAGQALPGLTNHLTRAKVVSVRGHGR